jgi:plasmid stabilization system protein ParE
MGKRVTRQIRWGERALYDFIEILNYIKLDSPTNAKRVKTRINNIIKTIPSNSEMFREDELKVNNDGTYRVFNNDSIRVSYKVEPKEIFIARVVHSSQEPNFF